MFDANGLVILAVGALLCFYGVRSVHLGVIAAGFGLGWIVSGLFNAGGLTMFLFGLIGAVSAWVVCSLIFRFAAYFVGGLTGAVGGARLADLVQPGDNSWAASAIIIVAIAVAAAFCADKYRARALLWLTSIGGASMVLIGVGRAFEPLNWVDSPDSAAASITSNALWIALSVAGWIIQRRLFADRLGIKPRQSEAAA
ncbi:MULTISPECIES: hypothetical protein [Gordonia]|uniref:DUF4203 domain-containing protein n=2 Tax=Gordonia TaxID=2053 RepID=L7LIK2_9ACTN|nr:MULTISPECIES: hypothetical protein [Gordonia]AUH67886.1 DUF4203 domain-containing protein [Gordonia sp. YC-JH1]KJR07921.1 membrane protein [Gordonia sihwensis]KXT58122.1 membrane protein [Gordonia sp. QH-12]WFN92409.1 DUF4203 domain-containing protein [Gordonia sihwensis]GAC60709.1 hypothetical protein GSI01S_11_00510 [Gordonia sihwensis NBRC 108236]